MLFKCVICGSPSRRSFTWTLADAKEAYKAIAADPFPSEATCPDYAMMRCTKCDLLFAQPMVPGNSSFYAWVTQVPNYYREARWEWTELRQFVRKARVQTLLEVGCGTGRFLRFITAESNVNAIGIDTHSPSVRDCVNSGLNAECSDLDQFVHRHPDMKFDLICAFHCLEHVPDPRSTVQAMSQILSPGGCVILSVPYSPTSNDVIATNPMNLPPHHLTQWNQESLMQLGKSTGLRASIITDDGIFDPSLLRTIYWLFAQQIFSSRNFSRASAMIGILLHPTIFFRCVHFVLTRDRIISKPAGDTALLTLRL
jgi:SAM-dependent methyltransferase